MKVALDISAALAGDSGIKFYVEEILGGFSRVGAAHEFILVTAFWRDPGRLAGLKLPTGSNFHLAFKRIPQRWLLPADEYLRLGIQRRWIGSWNVDIYHGLGNIVPPLGRRPSVVTIHHVGGALDVGSAWARFYFNALTKRSVNRASHVITVSEFSRREVLKIYRIPDENVTAIWEGGPATAFEPGNREDRTQRLVQDPYILYVGALLERKNLGSLIRAFARIRHGHPAQPLRLVLAGGRGRYWTTLAQLIGALELEPWVLVMDRLDRTRILRLYQHAEAFVYPSLLEGFGFPVLEAMACGVPVVASNSGAIPEVAGEAAHLVDATDPALVAGAIERILTDKEWVFELIQRGLRRAKEFSWDRTAQRTLGVYERVQRR